MLGGPEDAVDDQLARSPVVLADASAKSPLSSTVRRVNACTCRGRTRTQRRVERPARPGVDEDVEAVEEPGRRDLRVGDEGDGMPCGHEDLVCLIVAQHGNICGLSRGRQHNARRQDANYRQVRPPHFALSRSCGRHYSAPANADNKTSG